MHTRPTDLPDFTHPPLVEVVLGVQFNALPLKIIHAGSIWEALKDNYPEVEEIAPLSHVFETFSNKVSPKSAGIKLDILEKPDFPRIWLNSKDSSSLIQIQTDRFIQNWRKTESEQDYPRYEKILEEFKDNFNKFSNKMREIGFPEISIDQSEITYVNFIEFSESNYSDISNYLRIFNHMPIVEDFIPERLAANFSMAAVKNDTPYARLHVSTSPMISRISNKIGQKLELTFRGAPEAEDIESAITLMNDGRIKIVNSFTQLTTENMHELWGRKS